MNMLLGFIPFAVFALAERIFGMVGALAAAATVSLAVMLRDGLKGRSPKLLEVGSALLFGSLALWAYVGSDTWTILEVRLRVDAGLFLIVIVSLAVRRPFTMAYAKEQVPSELWASPNFLHANNVISCAWAGAFLVIGVADIVMLYAPNLPLSAGIITTVAALTAAYQFTDWYANKARSAP